MAGSNEVTTVTRLATDGIAGVWLFIGSPVLQAFALWLIGDLFDFWSAMISIVCLVGFLGGFVLLLIGRQFVAYHSRIS